MPSIASLAHCACSTAGAKLVLLSAVWLVSTTGDSTHVILPTSLRVCFLSTSATVDSDEQHIPSGELTAVYPAYSFAMRNLQPTARVPCAISNTLARDIPSRPLLQVSDRVPTCILSRTITTGCICPVVCYYSVDQRIEWAQFWW